MAFDIVEGISLPPLSARTRSRKYNLDELDVDQALAIPASTKHSESSIYAAARKLGIKVSIRKFDKNAEPDEDGDIAYRAGDTCVWRKE